MEKRLPAVCPSCGDRLNIRRLECRSCETSVEGDFELPVLARLTAEDQEFVLRLLKASGSLKELSAQYGISYPTVRNRLDAVIEKVDFLIANRKSREDGINERTTGNR